MKKIVVVGTNHAGTACVNTLLDKYNGEISVTAYDMNTNISFLGCGMALWIGGVIDSPDGLFYATPESLRAKGANVYMQHQITDINTDKHTVTVLDLVSQETKTDNYDELVLALGSWPIKPPIPGLDLDNIISVKLFQHAQQTIEKLKNPDLKNIVIVGAGYIGIELAEAFANAGKNVKIVDMVDEVVQRYYDSEFTAMMEERLIKNNIGLHLGETVREFTGVDGKVSGVVTDKQTYQADLVLFSVGFAPMTKFVKDKGFEMLGNGAIKVDENQKTSIPNVYAIGDCASIWNNTTQQDAYIALASNAVRTGIVAANCIAGKPTPLHGVQGSNAIHIYGLTLCSTGYTAREASKLGYKVGVKQATGKQKPDFMPDNYDVHVKIVYDETNNRILGAQIASEGDCTMAIHMFSLAIQEKLTIDRLMLLDLFFLPHHNRPVDPIMKALIS